MNPRIATMVLPACVILMPACVKKIQDPDGRVVDHTSPKSVLAGVFYAAKTAEPVHLAKLCDPEGKSDQSVLRICGLSKDSPDWSSFAREFADGVINGEPRSSGDNSSVDFVFGEPSNRRAETMVMIHRQSGWYLLSF